MVSFKKDTDWYRNLTNEYDKVKFVCSCGHRVIMPKWVDKRICDWCGRWVFRNKKDEFKYRLQEKMKEVK
jgi:hypothetical protein